jgi:hypothetical protein
MKSQDHASVNPEETQPTESFTPCDKCQLVAPEYVELKCNHSFCLSCLAQNVLKEGSTSPKNDITCLKCFSVTTLDENSIQALQSAIQHIIIQQNFRNQLLTKNKDLFKEVILEESRETFFTEEAALTKSLNNTGDNNFNYQRTGLVLNPQGESTYRASGKKQAFDYNSSNEKEDNMINTKEMIYRAQDKRKSLQDFNKEGVILL